MLQFLGRQLWAEKKRKWGGPTSAAFYSSLTTCPAQLAHPSLASHSSLQTFKHLRSQKLDFLCTTAAKCCYTSTGALTLCLSYTQLPMVENTRALLCTVTLNGSKHISNIRREIGHKMFSRYAPKGMAGLTPLTTRPVCFCWHCK